MRYEYKYLISAAGAEIVRSRLSAVLQPDPFAGSDGTYRITSLYFDDRFDRALEEKRDGVRDRFKFRIRYYNDDPAFIRLEKKAKHGAISEKLGVLISRETADRLLTDPFSVESDDPVLSEFVIRLRQERYAPVAFVDYRRRTFCYPVNDVRITIDSVVSGSRFGGSLFSPDRVRIPVLPQGESVLEIKFDRALPPHLRELLLDVPKTATAFSKFALCRMALC